MNYGHFIEVTNSRVYCVYYEMSVAYSLRNTTHRFVNGRLQSFATKAYRKFHTLGVL